MKIRFIHFLYLCLFYWGTSSCTDLALGSSLQQDRLLKDCKACKSSYRVSCLARGSTNPNFPPGLIAWRSTVTTSTANQNSVTTSVPYSGGEILAICEIESSLFCNSQNSCKRVWKTGGGNTEEDSSSSSSSSSSN